MAFEVTTDSETPTETPTFALPHEEVTAGDTGSKVSGEIVTMGSRTLRNLKESTRKLLGSQPSTADVVADRVAPAAATASPATSATAPLSVTPPVTTPEPHADTVRANRLAEHNARLLAENEGLRKQPSRSGPTDREKALDELEGLIVSNPVAAHRKLMAMAMGTPEDSKDLDSFEQYLESELTSKRIGVPLNEDSEAARKAARTLVAIQREMRARKADETKPAPAPEVESDGEAVSFIGNRTTALKHADKYPLLHAWGKHVDGQDPEKLVLNVMRHGVNIGEFDRNEPVDDLIDKASKRLEEHYTSMAAKLPTKPSTAPAAAEPDGKNADSTGQKVGTISNAIASVAPATLPAPKTPETYRTERERRNAIIRKNTV